jgi:hypothetical protein
MHSLQDVEWRRDLWFAVVVALAFGAFGVFTHRGLPPVDATNLSSYPSDSRIYLSMAAHRWVDADPDPTHATPWTLYDVRTPFRYRILVPWLASLLPFGPVLSLALVNYVSLVGAYVFLLLTCRRLGTGRLASAIGLGVAFAFVSHTANYSAPWLTDGFILLVLAAMTYAFVIDAFWMFAAWGLLGVFAREVPAVLLPLWCVRDVTRGVAVTVIAVTAVAVERVILIEPSGLSSAIHPAWLLNALKQTVVAGPSGASFWPPRITRKLITDIEYCWGWAFAILPIGLLLLPRDALDRFLPVALLLLAAACGMSLVATDTAREFMVLMPAIVVATAQVAAGLVAQKRVAWLAILAGLAAIQFCLSEPGVVFKPEAWATLAVRVPMIKIGAVWTIGAAILLRAELARRSREHWGATLSRIRPASNAG